MNTAAVLLTVAAVWLFVVLPAFVLVLYVLGGRRARLTAQAPSDERDRLRAAQAASDARLLAQREHEFRG